MVYSQVTASGGTRPIVGLIIRRSWVRSPPAPLFELSHFKCVFMGRQMGVAVMCRLADGIWASAGEPLASVPLGSSPVRCS